MSDETNHINTTGMVNNEEPMGDSAAAPVGAETKPSPAPAPDAVPNETTPPPVVAPTNAPPPSFGGGKQPVPEGGGVGADAQPGSVTKSTMHPAVKRAGILHSIAESLAGGPRFKTEIDPVTGTTKRTAVPLSGREIGMAIALEALTGGLSGLGAKGPGHIGQAAARGLAAGQQLNAQRQQEQKDEEQRAQGDFVRAASISQTNLRMAQTQSLISKQDFDTHKDFMDMWKPVHDYVIGNHGALDEHVRESDLLNKYHVTRDQAIPDGIVAKLDPNTGQQAIDPKTGSPEWENTYTVVNPDSSIQMPPETLKMLAEYGVPGSFTVVDGKRVPVKIPTDASALYKLRMVTDMVSQAASIRATQGALTDINQSLYNKPGAPVQSTPNAPDGDKEGTPLEKKIATGAGPQINDQNLAAFMASSADKYNVPVAVVRALATVESGDRKNPGNINVKAVSKAGAQGVMQLMPARQKDYNVSDPYDPAKNIDAGTHYLADLVEQKGSLRDALIAYHGKGSDGYTTGPQYADMILKMAGASQSSDAKLTPGGGVNEDAQPQNIDLQKKMLDGSVSAPAMQAFRQYAGLARSEGLDKAVDQMRQDKVNPDYIGQILSIFPANAYQTSKMQREQGELDMKAKNAENINAAKLKQSQGLQDHLETVITPPQGWQAADTSIMDMTPVEARDALIKQGVKVDNIPSNLSGIIAIARGEADLKTYAQKTYKDTGRWSEGDVLTYIRNFINPNYNESDYGAMSEFNRELKSSKTGTAGGTLFAAGTAANHLDLLAQAAHALKNRDLIAWNRIANTYGQQTGAAAPAVFSAILDKVNQEVDKVAHGSVPLESSLKSMTQNMSAISSPEQIDGVIDAYVKLMDGRIKEIDNRSRQVLNREIKVSPQTAKVFAQRGLDVPGWGVPYKDSSGRIIGLSQDGKTFSLKF